MCILTLSKHACAKKNTVIIIVGPTASGKTGLAVKLAQYLNTEIISADSRQCFKELNIGVAKPSIAELTLTRHHFISSHSIHNEVNTKVFEEYALSKTAAVFTRSPYVIMAGGTGLYVKAFCDGIDKVPDIPPAIRDSISSQYQQYGIDWLVQQVQKADAEYWSTNPVVNPQRLSRALEVKLHTGRSILHFHQALKSERPFNIIKIGINLPKPDLHSNIDNRVDQMMKDGLLNEAENLNNFRNLNALQTVGYKELFEYFDDAIIYDEAVSNIKLHTRQYAKRQLTWFRKDPNINWISSSESEPEFLLNKFIKPE